MSIDNVADISPRIQYVASAAQTDFDYPFPIFDDTDLVVDKDGVTQTLTTHYTVTGEGEDTGGTVTFVTPMTGNEVVTIYRDMAIERMTDFQQNGPYSSVSLNDDLDRITLVLQDLKSGQERSLRFSPTSEATAAETQFSPISNWLDKFVYINASGIPEPATAVEVDALTQATIGSTLYPQTAAELAAGVTPTNYYYPPGNVLRYGTNAVPGTTNMSVAIQAALTSTHTVYIPAGTYQCSGLTQSTNGQRIYGDGNLTVLRKRANGAILTVSGSHVEIEGVKFSGDASTPTFTGDNLVLNGDHPRLINCASRWAYARAVYAPVAHVQIIGTCDIYQTAATGASDYDIVIGVSGTATLYHAISGIYSSQATGGIQLIDTGSASVVGSQFGKLFVDAGTSPSGVNGGMYAGNRILGNVTVEISNAVFAANQFDAITLTFAASTSGCSVDSSNTFATGATVTNNGNINNLIIREISTGSVNKLKIGDDTSTAYIEFESDATGEIGVPNDFRMLTNNKFARFKGTGGTYTGALGMTSGDNLSLNNTSGATQVGASTTVQLVSNSAVAAQVDNSAVAGNTRFLVYDVDNATLERVTVGAADSGGAGFKVLRIPN